MKNNIAQYIEHTLLRAEATEADIERLCREAMEFGFHSVCVAPCHVALACGVLKKDSGPRVTTVAGFPLGTSQPGAKAMETRLALGVGAHEVDMVMRVGAALEGRWDVVEDEIRLLCDVINGDAVLKVIIETCYLDDAQKVRAVEAAVSAGADFVKTSTGFGPSGATVEDVRLMKETAAGRIKVKAAGGIRTLEAAESMIAAGADLIGTSSGPSMVR